MYMYMYVYIYISFFHCILFRPAEPLKCLVNCYSKRFAQSAGPGLRSCKILCCASHVLTKNVQKQDGMLAFFEGHV